MGGGGYCADLEAAFRNELIRLSNIEEKKSFKI